MKTHPTTTKSLLSQTIDVKNILDEYLFKVLLVGQSKSGKTLSAVTIPLIDNKPILTIALTPRTRAAIAGLPNIQLLEIIENEVEERNGPEGKRYSVVPEAWDKINDVCVELWELARAGDFPYSGILFDDVSAANRYAMNYILSLKKRDKAKKIFVDTEKGVGGSPMWEIHYVPHTMEMTRILASMLLSLPCHVIVCGHYEIYDNRDTGMSMAQPAVFSKNLRSQMPSWFNEVYECYSETRKGETKYYWRTHGTGTMGFIGSTLNKQNKLWSSPFEVNLDENPCGFVKLLELAKK